MEIETLKWFATLGVGGVLAGMIFWFYRKDVREDREQWKGQSEMLVGVVKDNTAAITANTMTIQALHRRDDRIEDVLSKLGFDFPHRAGEKPS